MADSFEIVQLVPVIRSGILSFAGETTGAFTNQDGAEVLSGSITPESDTHKVIVWISLQISTTNYGYFTIGLFRNNEQYFVDSRTDYSFKPDTCRSISMSFEDDQIDGSEITYSVRMTNVKSWNTIEIGCFQDSSSMLLLETKPKP